MRFAYLNTASCTEIFLLLPSSSAPVAIKKQGTGHLAIFS